MTITTLNFQTAPDHQVLAAGGKKVLRPGDPLIGRENKNMQLNFHEQDIAVQPRRQNLEWSIKPDVNPLQQEFQADTWVHLLELTSTFSFDEALLLCELSEDEWVVWIPDHGEAVLHTRQFCQAR